MGKVIRIAISGKSGCGNTTISKLVAEILNLQFINYTFRSLAEELKMDFREILSLSEKDDSIDRKVDEKQIKMAMESNGCVLGSRLAIWLLKEADLKVYLNASIQVRSERIIKREGGDAEEIMKFTSLRDEQDHKRYLKIYNIDNNDYKFADMIIDTENYTPQQISEMIVNRIRTKNIGN